MLCNQINLILRNSIQIFVPFHRTILKHFFLDNFDFSNFSFFSLKVFFLDIFHFYSEKPLTHSNMKNISNKKNKISIQQQKNFFQPKCQQQKKEISVSIFLKTPEKSYKNVLLRVPDTKALRNCQIFEKIIETGGPVPL